DGGAKSPEASARRLARMVAADLDEAPPEAWRALAAAFARRQLRELEEALDLVLARGELAGTAPLVGAGVGRFLVAELASRLGRPYRDLAGLVAAVDPATAAAAATSAPAVAVAALLAAD
ncbi:MAG TPA: hypothetical protein VFG43_05430, partial [Geminicoccaceae bacterium]|nr:hypothetical protein [Geminicoccaceae bacterium]